MIKKTTWLTNLLLIVLLASLTLVGCTEATNSSQIPENLDTTQVESTSNDIGSSNMNSNLPKLEGKAKVKLVVNGSPITMELDGNEAPITAGNFVDLVERGVYNGLAFHRVVKQPQPFVAQGGDPQGKDPNFPVSQMGTGGFVDPDTGERRFIPLEIKLEGETEPTYSRSMGRQAGFSADRKSVV